MNVREEDCMQIATSKTHGAKTLGVHWNTHSYMLHVSTPLDKLSTKREIASAAAQVWVGCSMGED